MKNLIVNEYGEVKREDSQLEPVIQIGGKIIYALSKTTAFEFDTYEEAIKIAKYIMQVSESILSVVVRKCFSDDESKKEIWTLIIRDYPLDSYLDKKD